MAEEFKDKSESQQENQSQKEDNRLPYEPPLLRKRGKVNDATKAIKFCRKGERLKEKNYCISRFVNISPLQYCHHIYLHRQRSAMAAATPEGSIAIHQLVGFAVRY